MLLILAGVKTMFRISSLRVFVSSLIVGFLLALLLRWFRTLPGALIPWKYNEISHTELYQQWLKLKNISIAQDNAIPFDSSLVVEAEFLQNNIRVLCVIPLPKTIDDYSSQKMMSREAYEMSVTVMRTWGKRCTQVAFISRKSRSRSPTYVVIDIASDEISSWKAWKEALHQISDSFLEDYNWFLWASPQNFVIMENLNYYLSVFDSKVPLYVGHAYKRWGILYNNADAAIVLSQGALRKLRNAFIKGQCEESSNKGDLSLGHCLNDNGVVPIDSRDFIARGRFLQYDPETHLLPNSISWTDSFWLDSFYPLRLGTECCSDYAVTFRLQETYMLHIMEFLVYHLKPFGISTLLESHRRSNTTLRS